MLELDDSVLHLTCCIHQSRIFKVLTYLPLHFINREFSHNRLESDRTYIVNVTAERATLDRQ